APEQALVQHADLGALDQAELQQAPFQLFGRDSVLGAVGHRHAGDHAAIAAARLAEAEQAFAADGRLLREVLGVRRSVHGVHQLLIIIIRCATQGDKASKGVMSGGPSGRMRSTTIGRSPRRTPASGTRAGVFAAVDLRRWGSSNEYPSSRP